MPIADYTPTVDDVGALLRTRTRSGAGEVGTFTTDTRPTDVQVQLLITQAAGKVAERLGPDLPEALWEAAKEAVTLRAAMLVELSFFGDQISVSRGPYTELKELYKEAYGDLVSAWKELGPDEQPGTGDDLSVAGGVVTAEPSCDVGPDWMAF